MVDSVLKDLIMNSSDIIMRSLVNILLSSLYLSSIFDSLCLTLSVTSDDGEDVVSSNLSNHLGGGSQYSGPCHEECVETSGCWGPGPELCKDCKHYLDITSKTCVRSCDNNTRFVYNENECWQCNEQCVGCKNYTERYHIHPEHHLCIGCKHFKRYMYKGNIDCVSKCNKYEYAHNKECKYCHSDCRELGCTGPGSNDCDPCTKPVISYITDSHGLRIDEWFKVEGCMLNVTCPESYFEEQLVLNQPFGSPTREKLSGKVACIKCHPLCVRCTSFGFNSEVCQECVEKYKNCSCPLGFYLGAPPNKEYPPEDEEYQNDRYCQACSVGCKECTNFTTCVRCDDAFYRVYGEGFPSENSPFLCTDKCPSNQQYEYYDKKYQKYCSFLDTSSSFLSGNIVYVCSVGLCVLGFTSVALFIRICRKAKTYQSQLKIVEQTEESVVLVPRNVSPTRTTLKIIKETDVKTTELLGRGAFGTVYKGSLSQAGDKSRITVAVKVLNPQFKETSTKDLLQEASVMAGIDHPNLLRLLAICVTSNVMLITHLMPLGDLHHYLRKHNKAIKPKTMLLWSVQISRGMAFLEERRLVHRDLAARNVLIQSLNMVKVSDFGLARALGVDEDMYASTGGKLPVKWMALESLKTGIFSHKSDVWALGVTVWEILTYGKEPYCVDSLHGLVTYLEAGRRLPQPEICSADVFTVLMNCWAQEPQERPSFEQIIEGLTPMLGDAESFVIIPEENDTGPTSEVNPCSFYFEIYSNPTTYMNDSHDYRNVEK